MKLQTSFKQYLSLLIEIHLEHTMQLQLELEAVVNYERELQAWVTNFS